MVSASIRLVTYYKFWKNLPYVDLRNTYLYFLSLSFYVKQLKKENKKTLLINIFIHSYRTKTYTILKTPMAHKTWSKEQIFIKYNMLIASIRGASVVKNLNYKIVFKILHSLITNYKEIETSSVFLKNILISYKFIHKLTT